MMSDVEQLQAQGAVYALAECAGSYFAWCASGLYRSDPYISTWQNAYESLEIDLPLATTVLAVQVNIFRNRIMIRCA